MYKPFIILLLNFKIIKTEIIYSFQSILKVMTSYVVRNGRLQVRQFALYYVYRQKDYNVPNYRIVPYKSAFNAITNDYYSNTFDQLQKEIRNLKNDYRNLIQTVWKLFSEVDRTPYDNQIMFVGLKPEEIYDKISLIRSLNAYEPDEESLKLSAIVKIDDNMATLNRDFNSVLNKGDHIEKFNNLQLNKQQSLYEILQEEQGSNGSKLDLKKQWSIKKQELPLVNQQTPMQPHIQNHKRSPSQISGQKRQNRRTSFLLKQKISLAFHEQQELRQILEEQLEKITQQLDQKNQYLSWTVEQLKIRNQLIEKLKEILISRDYILEKKQNENQQGFQIDNREEIQIIEEKDKQIGLLINSLIERTQQTAEDFQFLAKSIEVDAKKSEWQEKQKSQLQQNKESKDSKSIIDLHQVVRQQKYDIQDKIATSHTLQTIEQIKRSDQQQAILKPLKMNFDQGEGIKYLTKEHFLQAEKKSSQKIVLENVKMIRSITDQYEQGQNCI